MTWDESGAEVHRMVVRNPTTGAHEVHFVVTVEDLADAGTAILEAFESVISDEEPDPAFGGDVVFVVYGPAAPVAELPASLATVKSQLEAKAASLKTTSGQPYRVAVQQRRSDF